MIITKCSSNVQKRLKRNGKLKEKLVEKYRNMDEKFEQNHQSRTFKGI